MSEDTPQIIRDPSDLRKYRIELPNLYDDLGLTVYEFRLLAHYKRVGRCTESTSTTARVCNMSAGKVSETRQSLKDKKLIKMLKMPIPGGYSYVIEVADVWMTNFKKYAKNVDFQTPSPHEATPSHSEATPSPHETKKELIKNISSSSTAQRSKNATLYEQEIGQLTAMIADELADAEKTYPPDWIPEAIQIAALSNKRSWKYVLGILKNCKEKNIRPSLSKFEKGKNHGHSAGSAKLSAQVQQQAPSDADIAVAERIKAKRRQSVP